MNPTRFLKSTLRVLAIASAGVLLRVPSAHASIAYGSINNFDTVNDTGQECHGFEIELDDIHSTDVTYTYNWNHYGVPTITEDNSVAGHPKVFVRYSSAKNPDGSWAAYTAIPSGPIAPTQGHQFTNPSVNFGGEHFGVGYTVSPTQVSYNWLIDNGSGTLVHGGAVNVSTPSFSYVPPAAGVPAQVVAAIVPPAPPAPPVLEFGKASWVKEIRTTTHNAEKIKLRDLVTDDPADPTAKSWRNGEPDEVEAEWQILQTDSGNPNGANNQLVGAPEPLPNGDEVVTRRYEFYTYTGPLDNETGEAMAQSVGPDGIHGSGTATVNGVVTDLSTIAVVGEFTGAQMAGADVNAQLGLIDHLQNGEINTPYTARTIVLVGTAPFTASGTGTLPAGMTFDEVTGIVSGTPTESGSFSYTVSASDGQSPDVKKNYTFYIAAANEELPPRSLIDTIPAPLNGGSTIGDGGYAPGDNVTVSATAKPGYAFANWTDNGTIVSNSSSYSFVVDVNHSLVANFVPSANEHTISTSASPSTSGTSSGDGTYADGTSVTVIATPYDGYQFAAWSEGGVAVSGSATYIFTATASRTLIAGFLPVQPTLSSPTSSAKFTGELAVDFTLPAAAQPGTVVLTFTGTAGIPLTLSGSMEVAGTHHLTFSPGNLASSPDIAAGGPLPDGIYGVTLSYQPTGSGQPVTSATATGVVIDSVAPTVSGSFAPLSIPEGALPDYTAQAIAQDNVGILGIAQSPAAGSNVTQGTVPVTIVATDLAGNTGTTSFNVQVTPVITNSSLVKTADPVTGEAGGTIYTRLGIPSLNDEGDLAFVATIKTGTVSRSAVLAGIDPTVVAKQGDLAPGTSFGFRSFYDPLLGQSGNVAFLAKLSGAPLNADLGLWTNAFGSLALVAYEGDAAAGARISNIVSVAVESGTIAPVRIAYVAKLTGTGVTSVNDTALLSYDGSTTRTLLRNGTTVDINGVPRTLSRLTVLTKVSGADGQGFGLSEGRIIANLGFADGTSAVASIPADGSSAEIIAMKGDAAVEYNSGAIFTSFKAVGQNSTAGAVFIANIGGAVVSSSNSAIYEVTGGASGGLDRIVTKGSTQAGPGLTFTSFTAAANNSRDHVLFTARVSGTGVTSANDTGIWLWDEAGLFELAREGSTAPETGGGIWKTFSTVSLPDGSNALFTCTLLPGTGTPATTTSNDACLFGRDTQGKIHLLVREGATMVEGETIKSFKVLGTVFGSPSQARSANARNGVVFLATFPDGTQGIVKVALP